MATLEIDDVGLASLRSHFARMNTDDVKEAEEADRAFHLVIADATRSAVILNAVTEFGTCAIARHSRA